MIEILGVLYLTILVGLGFTFVCGLMAMVVFHVLWRWKR